MGENMEFEIIKVRNNLCKIKLTVPYTCSVLLEEFKKEKWVNHADYEERAGNPHLHRAALAYPNSVILQEIVNYISSDEVKEKIVYTMYDMFPNIQYMWDGWSKEKMYKSTLWGGQFLKDGPGFMIEPHIDTRLQILTSIIYFIEDNDPNQATTFYTDKNCSNPWVAETGIGLGTLHINDYDVWHEGSNRSEKDRFLMSLGLIINVK
jgi:hypothetical protein